MNNKKIISPIWDGDECKLGKWIVGKAFQTCFISRGSKKKYQATCSLPGIKSNLGLFEDIELAKSQVEKACLYWFDKIDLDESK